VRRFGDAKVGNRYSFYHVGDELKDFSGLHARHPLAAFAMSEATAFGCET